MRVYFSACVHGMLRVHCIHVYGRLPQLIEWASVPSFLGPMFCAGGEGRTYPELYGASCVCAGMVLSIMPCFDNVVTCLCAAVGTSWL